LKLRSCEDGKRDTEKKEVVKIEKGKRISNDK
jgi:hypothetical protein